MFTAREGDSVFCDIDIISAVAGALHEWACYSDAERFYVWATLAAESRDVKASYEDMTALISGKMLATKPVNLEPAPPSKPNPPPPVITFSYARAASTIPPSQPALACSPASPSTTPRSSRLAPRSDKGSRSRSSSPQSPRTRSPSPSPSSRPSTAKPETPYSGRKNKGQADQGHERALAEELCSSSRRAADLDRVPEIALQVCTFPRISDFSSSQQFLSTWRSYTSIPRIYQKHGCF